MVVTLENTKAWLRIESTTEDALIESFIGAAEELVEGILRFPLSELEVVPESIHQAIYYGVSQFYEKRNELVMTELIQSMRGLLAMHRREAW